MYLTWPSSHTTPACAGPVETTRILVQLGIWLPLLIRAAVTCHWDQQVKCCNIALSIILHPLAPTPNQDDLQSPSQQDTVGTLANEKTEPGLELNQCVIVTAPPHPTPVYLISVNLYRDTHLLHWNTLFSLSMGTDLCKEMQCVAVVFSPPHLLRSALAEHHCCL